jgi:hypothetical protein
VTIDAVPWANVEITGVTSPAAKRAWVDAVRRRVAGGTIPFVSSNPLAASGDAAHHTAAGGKAISARFRSKSRQNCPGNFVEVGASARPLTIALEFAVRGLVARIVVCASASYARAQSSWAGSWYRSYSGCRQAFKSGDYATVETKPLAAVNNRNAPKERGRRAFYGQIRDEFLPEHYSPLSTTS